MQSARYTSRNNMPFKFSQGPWSQVWGTGERERKAHAFHWIPGQVLCWTETCPEAQRGDPRARENHKGKSDLLGSYRMARTYRMKVDFIPSTGNK